MDNTEAQFVLQACRPGGQDADDPSVAAALEQARLDPELGAWFAEQQALDAAIAGKLQSFPVPANLKADILAGKKVVRPVAFRRGRLLVALAAAASLALLASVVFWKAQVANAKPQFASFHTDMGRFLNHIDRLDFQTDDIDKAKHWLETKGGQGELLLPARLEGQRCVGCRVMDWKGSKVSLVCYYLDKPSPSGATKKQIDEIHMLVIDREALQDPPSSSPQFSKAGKWELASWSDKRYSYILAGIAQGNYLKDYFSREHSAPKPSQ